MGIWTPAFFAKSGSSVLFNRLELNEFESGILNNPKATERDAANFFSRFPKFLFLGVGREIRRESVLVGSDGEPMGRVDFFRRSFGTNFWDIIELKDPQLSVVAGTSGNHPRLSFKVSAALSQAQDYRDWISENETMQLKLLKKGIRVYRPKLLVVAGKRGTEIPEELVHMLADRAMRGGTELLTYSDIFNFSKEHYKSHGIIVAPANIDFDVSLAYQGTHNHRVSGSSVVVPRRWSSDEKELTLILWPKDKAGPCVRVLPGREMRKLMEDINSMPNSDPNKVILKRFINAESTTIQVDRRRRIHLPKEMAAASGITDEALFIGLGDRFEIWNPERYQQVKAYNEIEIRKMFNSDK